MTAAAVSAPPTWTNGTWRQATLSVAGDVSRLPIQAEGRAVTFWLELPPHQDGAPDQAAAALRRLHDAPVLTEFVLAPLAPFVRLAERIDTAATLSGDDRDWLHRHLADLRTRYTSLPAGLPHCVVHGDAWVGSVVSTQDDQVVLLDLEQCSVGPPEWDLVSTAIKHTSFRWITAEEYRDFCRRYGHDVTAWDGFALLGDIRELHMTCYVAQRAAEYTPARAEAQRRVDCLRGWSGPRHCDHAPGRHGTVWSIR